MPKYHITAINRLTRIRESVTPPCSKEKALRIIQREKNTSSRKRSWIYPKMESCPPRQLSLQF